jgi:5-methylcytosine-specific restriction protein A
VLHNEYKTLFTIEELSIAKDRLSEFGYATEEINSTYKLPPFDDDSDLDRTIDLDLEAEQAEEGHGIEGNVKYYYGKRYERDSKNRKLAIKRHGLNCYVCGFNFEEVYGGRGKDFIEVHHIKPLSTLEEAVEINPENDLVPLCANCHRMVHRRKDEVLSIEELIKIVDKYRQ